MTKRWLYFCAVETSTLLACHYKISNRSGRNTWAFLLCGIGSRRPQQQTGVVHVFFVQICCLLMSESGIRQNYFWGSKSKQINMAQIPVKLYRQAIIYKNIRQKTYIGLPELIDCVQKELLSNGYDTGFSQRSIQRDIQEMNVSWISILYDKQRKGYYIPTDETVDTIWENLLDHVTLLTTLQTTQNLSDYVLLEQRKMTGLHHIPVLIPALEKNLVIEFDYQKFTDHQSSHRIVEPYFLKEFSGRWYLLAKECNETTMKTWGLERISHLTVGPKHFQRDLQFNPQEYYKSTFGIYTANLPTEEVVLSFTPKGGQYILTRPLHPSQVTLINNVKEIRIKMDLKLTNDFIMELLSLTDKMTIISPQSLKEHFQNIYQQAINRMTENI